MKKPIFVIQGLLWAVLLFLSGIPSSYGFALYQWKKTPTTLDASRLRTSNNVVPNNNRSICAPHSINRCSTQPRCGWDQLAVKSGEQVQLGSYDTYVCALNDPFKAKNFTCDGGYHIRTITLGPAQGEVTTDVDRALGGATVVRIYCDSDCESACYSQAASAVLGHRFDSSNPSDQQSLFGQALDDTSQYQAAFDKCTSTCAQPDLSKLSHPEDFSIKQSSGFGYSLEGGFCDVAYDSLCAQCGSQLVAKGTGGSFFCIDTTPH